MYPGEKVDFMENTLDRISVIVPAYNAMMTIERALASIVVQNYQNMEVLVVDDASADETSQVVEAFEGLDIRLIRSSQNLGASGARNLAIKQANGNFLAFLDADDEWLEGKLLAQLALFRSRPDSIFVTCEANLLGPGGRKIGRVNPNRERPDGADGWKLLLKYPCVATPCVLVRKEFVEKVGLFDPFLASGEDQDLWIRLAMEGPVAHADEILVNVYDTSNSLSKRERSQSVETILPIIKKRIDERENELSKSEIDQILATRYQSVGRTHCEAGRLREGFGFLLKASRLGSEPIGNTAYFAKAAPVVRHLKRIVNPPRLGAEHHVELKDSSRPNLMVVVDTEEEFDWSKPFSTSSRSIESILYQDAAQELFEKFDVRPTYVLDYPIVENQKSVDVVKGYFDREACQVGAHLQPWVNPPYKEELSNFNSYPGNLNYSSEYEKLRELTERISSEISHRPTIYKAGRYGFGPSTAKILKSLGYMIDVSIVPHTDFRAVDGFDFSNFMNAPVWLGDDLDLLEIPLTRGFAGLLAPAGPRLFPLIDGKLGEQFHVPGLLARLGLLERITLTPEGISLAEMKRLTRKMISRGRRIFCMTYHSSTLMPGGSPYVTTQDDREAFVKTIKEYLEFFFAECNGQPVTPEQLMRQAVEGREGG
jgi:glycosyltransferase involved in cell wall biosynthesis